MYESEISKLLSFSPPFFLPELVANRFLEEVELNTDERSATVTICKHFHQSARELSDTFLAKLGRHNYVTPTSYLELISSFKKLLGASRGTIVKMKNRYVVGLEKLEFAASQVAIFSSLLQCTYVQKNCTIYFALICSYHAFHSSPCLLCRHLAVLIIIALCFLKCRHSI